MGCFSHVAIALALVAIPSFAEPPDDSLPEGAIARLGSYRFYHGGEFLYIAVSPDGKLLASCNEPSDLIPRSVCVWQAATGMCLRRFPIEADSPVKPAFSADGSYLAIPLAEYIEIWDLTVECNHLIVPIDGELCRDAVQFTKTGHTLIVKYAAGRVVWRDLDSGRIVREVWAWPTGKPDSPSNDDRQECSSIVLSPDEKLLAFSIMHQSKTPQGWQDEDAGPLRVVDVESGRTVNEWSDGGDSGLTLFSPDSQALAIAREESFRLLNIANGQVIADWSKPHESPIAAIFTANRRMLAAYNGWQVQLVELQAEHQEIKASLDSNYDVFHLVFFPDAKTVAMADHAWIRCFDIATGNEHDFGPRNPFPITRLSFENHGRTVVARAEYAYQPDEMTGEATIFRKGAKPKHFESCIRAVSAEVPVLVTQDDCESPVLRDAASFKILRPLECDCRARSAGVFSKDARFVALKSEPPDEKNSIELFQVATGKCIRRFVLEVCWDSFDLAAIASDGSFLVLIHDTNAIAVLKTATGHIKKFECPGVAHAFSCMPPAFSADGRTLALPARLVPSNPAFCGVGAQFGTSGGDEGPQILRILALPEGKEICRIPAGVTAALSPDGRLVAVTFEGQGLVTVFETASGLPYATFEGHRDVALSVAFSPNGRTMASGGADGIVFLWNLAHAIRPYCPLKAKETMAELWDDLLRPNVPAAWAAIVALSELPEAVDFLHENMQPTQRVSGNEIEPLIRSLASISYGERERASHALALFGELALPHLEQALETDLTLEARRRVQTLMDRTRSNVRRTPTFDVLRQLRAIAVLEHIGTSEAIKLLQELAVRPAAPWQSLAATAALARLRPSRGEPTLAATREK
jgi:WD40 repeat protein